MGMKIEIQFPRQTTSPIHIIKDRPKKSISEVSRITPPQATSIGDGMSPEKSLVCQESLTSVMQTSRMALLNIQHDIVDRIRSRRLIYFSHVQPSQWPNQALYGRVHGNRHQRRPRKRWTDNISDDCQMMGFSLTQATRGSGHKTMEEIHEAVPACLAASP